MNPQPSAYRSDIDGLRAIAITVVVLYHAGFTAFGGGFVGVDIFFVLSGFLITGLLRGELARTGTIRLRDFYARRVRRLLPALLTVLVAVLVLWTIFLPGLSDPWKFSRSLRWSLAGLANLFFRRNTEGYFDGPSSEMPLLHLWSLSVEEQFYLVWPFLLLVGALPFLRKRASSNAALALGGALVLASFAFAESLVRRGPATWAFYDMPARAWELGVGAWLATWTSRPSAPLSSRVAAGIGVAGLAAIGGSVLFFSGATPFPGLAAAAPVLGTAALIGIGARAPENFLSRALAWKPLVRVGILSYGWYLWHWPLLAIAQIENLGLPPSRLARVVIVVGSLGLAELSLRFVETPIRSGAAWKRVGAFRVIAAGMVASGIVALLGSTLPDFEMGRLRARYGASVIDGVWERPKFGTECFDETAIGTSRCDFSFGPAKAGKSRIAIWGDSHAGSYFPMLTDYAEAHGIDASLYCAGKTPPLLPGGFGDAVIRDLRKKIAAPGAGPISVALVARWTLYSGKPAVSTTTKVDFLDPERTGAGSLRAMEAGLDRTLTRLHEIGVARTLVILPYPEFRTLIFRCLVKGMETCSRPESDAESFRSETRAVLERVVRRHNDARLLDPFKAVCDEGKCPIVLDDFPVVIDDNHPSVRAANRMGWRFSGELDAFAGLTHSNTR